MGLPDRFISFWNHLNHATVAGRADGIAKSVSLIQGIERQDFWKQVGGILALKAFVIGVLDDAKVFSNVDNIRWNGDTLGREFASRAIQIRADVVLAVRTQFGG